MRFSSTHNIIVSSTEKTSEKRYAALEKETLKISKSAYLIVFALRRQGLQLNFISILQGMHKLLSTSTFPNIAFLGENAQAVIPKETDTPLTTLYLDPTNLSSNPQSEHRARVTVTVSDGHNDTVDYPDPQTFEGSFEENLRRINDLPPAQQSGRKS